MSQLQHLWKTSNAATRIIIINIAAYVLINVPIAILHLMNAGGAINNLMSWLALSGDLGRLLFRPWTLFSHMFIHSGIFHLAFNLLSLYFIQQLFSRYFDDRRFINVYFVGGLSGALVFLLSVNVFPVFASDPLAYTAVGASAAVMAVLVAVCTYRAQDEVFLFGIVKMQLRWVAVLFVLLDIIGISGGNEGGHLAHLGGALFGFLWGMNLSKGRDLAAWFDAVQNVFTWKPSAKKSPLSVAHKQKFSDDEWNQSKKARQARVDEILDKISRSGYDSLSKDEKALLFELSKDN